VAGACSTREAADAGRPAVAAPDPERQVQFLFDVQRLVSDGAFADTYKFALLISPADLAVERGDETTEALPPDTRDLAERSIGFY
jgi:hypothetical protein